MFSDDMFEARFLKEGIMNPETGADYRRCILDVGGTKVNHVVTTDCLFYFYIQDASEMLRAFLGRDPNSDAFLRKKGLQV